MAAIPTKLTKSSQRELKIPRLLNALRKSSVVMETYRRNRKNIIAADAGDTWSDNAGDKPRPWNGIGLFRRVILQALVNTTPRVMLSTWRRDQKNKIAVKAAQNWCNKQFERIHLGSHLRRAFDDALHLMGIMKVGIVNPVDAERSGWRIFSGEAFAQTVSFDDYLCDVQARNLEEVTFEGQRCRGSAEMINRLYKLRGEKKVEGQQSQTHNQDGDERSSMIGRGYLGGEYDEFGDMADYWEIFVPGHRKILVFKSRNGLIPSQEDDLIGTADYVGPERGPYIKLGFTWVPDNLFPRGPIMDLFYLDHNINAQLRKIIRQANRFKQIDLYNPRSKAGMTNIMEASDGDTVPVDNPEDFRPWISSPPNPQLFGVAQGFMQIFNKLAGNLDTLGGLARQAGTASQEQMLNQNAAGMLGALQREALKFTTNVMDSLVWYYWNDPTGVMRDEFKAAADPTVGVTREVYPAFTEQADDGTPAEFTRDMPWEDMEVTVDPYSMTAETPQSKLQHIRTLVQTLTPLAPLMQQSGLNLDYRVWLENEAELMNNPIVNDLVHLEEPRSQEQEGMPHDATKPAATSRTVTRRSESEATEEGGVKDMMQQLMGQGMTGVNDYQSSEGFQ